MLHRTGLVIASLLALLMVNHTAMAAAVTNTYSYDALGRLTLVSDAINGDRKYAYDAAGNRKQVLSNTANRPPVAVNDSLLVRYAPSVTLNVLSNDSDPDGDALTIVNNSSCSTAQVSQSGATLILYARVVPSMCTFTYTIADPSGLQSTATVQVNITN